MGEPEAFSDVVRVVIGIDVFMVSAVIGAPVEGGVLEGGGAEDEDEEFDWKSSFESEVRE